MSISAFRYLDGVTTLAYDEALCTGCRMCTKVCPRGVLTMTDERPRRARVTDRDACLECDACARNCEAGAFEVRSGAGCAGMTLQAWFPRLFASRDRGCC